MFTCLSIFEAKSIKVDDNSDEKDSLKNEPKDEGEPTKVDLSVDSDDDDNKIAHL